MKAKSAFNNKLFALNVVISIPVPDNTAKADIQTTQGMQLCQIASWVKALALEAHANLPRGQGFSTRSSCQFASCVKGLALEAHAYSCCHKQLGSDCCHTLKCTHVKLLVH